MALITSNSFSGLANLFSRNNDKYVMTPKMVQDIFNFSKTEQYISIDGNESEIFRTTPQLFTVIHRRAAMLSNGIWKHYDKNGELIVDSSIIKLLEKPNPFQAGNEWLIQLDIQKSIYGNSFTYCLKGSKLAETPSALWNLAPKLISLDRSGKIYQQTKASDIVKQYKLNYNKETGKSDELFTPNEILHRNIQDPDDPIVGQSPLEALKMPISNIRAAYGFRNVLMIEKGALGMLSNDSKNSSGAIPLTDKERTAVETQFSKDYGITDRQRKIIISSASLKWQAMSYPTKDMMLFEEIDENTRSIIDAYGLNEALFSLGKGTTFDNYKEGEKAAYQDTIIPEADDLAVGMTEKLNLQERGETLQLDYSHLPVLQEDQERTANIEKTKAEASQILVNTGLYTNNEIKEIINLTD